MCSEFSGEQPLFKTLHETRQAPAAGNGARGPGAAPAQKMRIAAFRPDAEAVRAELCAKFPHDFEHGYRFGYLGENQPPCDPAGYIIGHHTWPLDRKNAWFAGFNLGYVERGEGDG